MKFLHSRTTNLRPECSLYLRRRPISKYHELARLASYCTVPTSTAAALNGSDDSSSPVLQEIWQVSDRVSVRKEVPSACSMAAVIQPGSEDEVGRNRQEDTEESAWILLGMQTYMMMNHVNHPHPLLETSGSSSSTFLF